MNVPSTLPARTDITTWLNYHEAVETTLELPYLVSVCCVLSFVSCFIFYVFSFCICVFMLDLWLAFLLLSRRTNKQALNCITLACLFVCNCQRRDKWTYVYVCLLKTCLTMAVLTTEIASDNSTCCCPLFFNLLRTNLRHFYVRLSGQSAADKTIIGRVLTWLPQF